MTMPGTAFSEDGAGRNIQGGKQCRRSMAHIVVGDALDISQSHRQHRLRTIESLNLALLVHTEHQCVIGRVRYKPTMSRTFSTKNASVESLKVRVRCGCSAKV